VAGRDVGDALRGIEDGEEVRLVPNLLEGGDAVDEVRERRRPAASIAAAISSYAKAVCRVSRIVFTRSAKKARRSFLSC